MNKNSQEETEWNGTKEFLILWRNAENSKTDPCPFCKKRHNPGKGDGHRIAECMTTGNVFIRFLDKKVFKQEDGYIIKTRKKD